jgi:sulfane dehydrogenase subunit SoxC
VIGLNLEAYQTMRRMVIVMLILLLVVGTGVGVYAANRGASNIDITAYRLNVDGLVQTPLSLTYESLTQYPTITEDVLLVCPGVFEDERVWTGVPVTTLLAEAGIKPEASQVTFHGSDGYTSTLSLGDINQDGVFLAYKVNGQTLPKADGYPVRLVVKGKAGAFWVRCLIRIEVT